MTETERIARAFHETYETPDSLHHFSTESWEEEFANMVYWADKPTAVTCMRVTLAQRDHLRHVLQEVLTAWDQDSAVYDRETNLAEAIEQLRKALGSEKRNRDR